jgi:hypothetical protein
LAAAQKLDPATQAALAKNPNDPAAGAKAVSEISGVPVGDVATIATLNAQHGPALQAAQAVDRQTLTALLTNPADAAAAQKAVQQITSKLGISPADAQARLQDLATIPTSQLLLLQKDGAKLQQAEQTLKRLGQIPAGDLALLKKVQNAAHDSPRQWKTIFWIAVGGEVLFIPLIFMLVGYWSPRRARAAEREHDVWLESELAKLHG